MRFSAWLGSFWPLHNWMIGMWSKQAQDEYWANSYDAVSSTAWNMLTSKIEPFDGGIRLSGHWDFSSGIDHASWAMLFIPGPRMALVPKKDFRIVDNWHVTGLCGDGQQGGVSRKLLRARSSHPADGRCGRRPYHRAGVMGTPFYKLPIYTWLTYTLVAPVIGMAQGAIDSFEELMRVRVEGISGGRAGERQSNHLRLAESAAEIDAARLTLRHNINLLIGLRRLRRNFRPANACASGATSLSPASSAIGPRNGCSIPAARTLSCARLHYSASRATSTPLFIREY